jgi:hypothetical protein
MLEQNQAASSEGQVVSHVGAWCPTQPVLARAPGRGDDPDVRNSALMEHSILMVSPTSKPLSPEMG